MVAVQHHVYFFANVGGLREYRNDKSSISILMSGPTHTFSDIFVSVSLEKFCLINWNEEPFLLKRFTFS